jgi:hypothetical protein
MPRLAVGEPEETQIPVQDSGRVHRVAVRPTGDGSEVSLEPFLGHDIGKIAPNTSSEGLAPPTRSLDFAADPEEVRAVAEGERLGYGHLINPAFATEVSMIDPLPHQRIAVYEHMLPRPRLRFLLADEPGGGKTIMAGLYLREMLARRLLRRILIVPPAGLVGNWKRELEVLFGLIFRIVVGSDARAGNPFAGPGGDLIIVSVDTLASERPFARLQLLRVRDPFGKLIAKAKGSVRVDGGAVFDAAEGG